jgi:hypothetical protein
MRLQSAQGPIEAANGSARGANDYDIFSHRIPPSRRAAGDSPTGLVSNPRFFEANAVELLRGTKTGGLTPVNAMYVGQMRADCHDLVSHDRSLLPDLASTFQSSGRAGLRFVGEL